MCLTSLVIVCWGELRIGRTDFAAALSAFTQLYICFAVHVYVGDAEHGAFDKTCRAGAAGHYHLH